MTFYVKNHHADLAREESSLTRLNVVVLYRFLFLIDRRLDGFNQAKGGWAQGKKRAHIRLQNLFSFEHTYY